MSLLVAKVICKNRAKFKIHAINESFIELHNLHWLKSLNANKIVATNFNQHFQPPECT